MQELVQLRMVSAQPKASEADAACRRQLDVLLADNPLRAEQDVFRCMRSCFLQIARGPILQRLQRALCFDLPRRRGL